MAQPSELAVLVETESRLDRAIASARETAAKIVEAAKRSAADDARAAEDSIAGVRARIVHEVAAQTDHRVRTIAQTARDTCARYDAVHGERLAEIARRLARRVAELAEEDT